MAVSRIKCTGLRFDTRNWEKNRKKFEEGLCVKVKQKQKKEERLKILKFLPSLVPFQFIAFKIPFFFPLVMFVFPFAIYNNSSTNT